MEVVEPDTIWASYIQQIRKADPCLHVRTFCKIHEMPLPQGTQGVERVRFEVTFDREVQGE